VALEVVVGCCVCLNWIFGDFLFWTCLLWCLGIEFSVLELEYVDR